MRRTLSSLCLIMSVLILLVTRAHAQILPIDDFNDGDDLGWSHTDTTFGTAWGPALFDASSGALHMETTDLVPTDDPFAGFIEASWEASANKSKYANGFVRGIVRADTQGTTCGFLLRANDDTGSDYGFYGSSSFGTFYIELFTDHQTILAMADPALFPFHAGEDWYIEGGVVGHTLTLKAWRVGDPEPTEPILTVTDKTFGSSGGTEICAIAFFDPAAITGPVQVSATFDEITFRRPARK